MLHDNMPAGEMQGEVFPTLKDDRFPWKGKKGGTFQLARAYLDVSRSFESVEDSEGACLARSLWVDKYRRYAIQAANCSTYLAFEASSKTGARRLVKSNFCRLRLCPLCVARKARQNGWMLSQIMNRTQEEHPGIVYLFLTLTVRNCAPDKLGETITLLTKAWDRLRKQRAVERAWEGWFRAIEITLNLKDWTYHPHIHAILAVDSHYLGRKSGLYLSHEDLVRRWREALRVAYDPGVYITRTKRRKAGDTTDTPSRDASLEAAKYATKDSDYLNPKLSREQTAKIVYDYTEALRGRRMTAFGGTLKDTAKALKMDNLDNVDLLDRPDSLRDDVFDLLEEYKWSFGAGDYILAARKCARKGGGAV